MGRVACLKVDGASAVRKIGVMPSKTKEGAVGVGWTIFIVSCHKDS